MIVIPLGGNHIKPCNYFFFCIVGWKSIKAVVSEAADFGIVLSLFPNFSFLKKKTNPAFPLGKSSLIKRMSILFFPKLQEVAAGKSYIVSLKLSCHTSTKKLHNLWLCEKGTCLIMIPGELKNDKPYERMNDTKGKYVSCGGVKFTIFEDKLSVLQHSVIFSFTWCHVRRTLTDVTCQSFLFAKSNKHFFLPISNKVHFFAPDSWR